MSVSALENSEQSHTNNTGTFLPTPRQIRFVSTDGQPHAKRRRINAACLTCRKRKTRCSGERPECKTCTDNGHVCAGYADRSQRKDDDKPYVDGDDDTDDASGGSSPRRHKSDIPTSNPTRPSSGSDAPKPIPPLTKNDSLDSNSSAKRYAKEDPDIRSPESVHTQASSSFLSSRNRVPFFRYFGPTAIVPGFKQMVVQIKDRDHRRSAHSLSGSSPASGAPGDGSGPVTREPSPQEIVFYDATDPAPNAPLITHLCENFFTHLGCNYPFLQRERFLKDLEDKRVDAILVDAVCAVAARFSSNPSLTRPSDQSTPLNEKGEVKRAFRGAPYAQRAMSAVTETFSCPTLAVAQACLLLAYEEFGTDRDSGLWMYLGTSIRMAQDMGIQKLEGMQLEGRMGPTPKTAKLGDEGKREERRRAEQQRKLERALVDKDDSSLEDRRASEQERIDTFWAIFFLDRAVSSGVGRPVTLRDKDIEISFPYRPDETMVNGYPHPFPAMIRIVHLYGRIADVINNIKNVDQVTPDVLKRLQAMEKDLTGIYQRLSPRLHFNATNFQHYVKAEQGTNFILLHFWFHTLIVLLHQPTLLHSFEGRIQQLFPDSRELSMSSAKTVADILAFAELIDVKSFIGNPFTSQPMYIAACAFLAEARAHASQPSSRQTSPPDKNKDAKLRITEVELFNKETVDVKRKPLELDAQEKMDSKTAAKHSLLATAANQNYQRCYKALKVLDSYWAGCRYILTALDQKSKGLMDPLLFTQEDVDGEMPSTEPSFTTPGWRRSSHGVSSGERRTSAPWSPKMDWSQAIGWSLTGTTNSPAPNLSFLYPNPTQDNDKHVNIGVHPHRRSPSRQAKHQQQNQSMTPTQTQMNGFPGMVPPQTYSPTPGSMMPPPRSGGGRPAHLPYDPVSTSDADLLLGLHSPYSVGSAPSSLPPTSSSGQHQNQSQSYDYAATPPQPPPSLHHQTSSFYATPTPTSAHTPGFTDMLIESQDVDMSGQTGGGLMNLDGFSFPGSDMIPWLEYLPQDVLNYFGQSGDMNQVAMHQGDPMVMGSGPGPPTSDPGSGGPGSMHGQ